MWQKTPIPMYNKIYYFNCTNPQEVMKSRAKPLLKQVGPYVFREEHVTTRSTRLTWSLLQHQMQLDIQDILVKTTTHL